MQLIWNLLIVRWGALSIFQSEYLHILCIPLNWFILFGGFAVFKSYMQWSWTPKLIVRWEWLKQITYNLEVMGSKPCSNSEETILNLLSIWGLFIKQEFVDGWLIKFSFITEYDMKTCHASWRMPNKV
jgi:hypothetical protein